MIIDQVNGLGISVADQAEHTVVGPYKIMTLELQGDKPLFRGISRVYGNEMYGARGKIPENRTEYKGAMGDIERINPMAHVDDLYAWKGFQQGGFYGGNIMILLSEIRRKSDEPHRTKKIIMYFCLTKLRILAVIYILEKLTL
jgi:hypothetical protein